ncbi:phosphatidate cytidylyltransferase [Spiroplasma sp. BIUS-1]|uniref:phosphatidate cytidylyltransferase n=1 Tax=Spiroplasma sp. BIUS-1 TaxID=216964 RepID=UPI0013979927|nr:phosphatidate cytidylyltransferase [Spiroplasma sp. BIUS-1]QHX36822.1 phosphatidate cytidylyltransferase [Spiroplasma sp. BIUS-1]
MKNNDKDFEITDTVEVTPEVGDEIGKNRFKLDSVKKNFRARVLSTIVLLILLLGFVGSGAIYTSLLQAGKTNNADIASYFSIILTAALTALCLFEMNKTNGFKVWYYQILIIVFGVILLLFPMTKTLYNFSFYSKMSLATWLAPWQFPIIITVYLVTIIVIGVADKRIDTKKALINFVMTMVIVLGLKAFSITSLAFDFEKSKEAIFSFNTILWIWIMIILSDSFQYIGGMRFGKTKLSPNVSPKKTWEGALIGMGTAAVFGIAYAMIFQFVDIFAPFQPLREVMQILGSRSVALEVIIYILLALVFPIIGLFGDLLFSWVKRQANIKDYSNLIPGHGGALDRLDSILFSLFILFIFISIYAA